MKLVKIKIITGNLGIPHLKFCICYINELVQELLDNTSIFYYDAQLSVNAIMLEPLLAGSPWMVINITIFFNFEVFICTSLSLYSQI